MHIEPGSIRKILLINLAYIGDVILSTPLTKALKKAYPSAEITMLVIPSTVEVARGNPYVDHVIAYDKRGSHRSIRNVWSLIKNLRQHNYDMALTTNFSLRSPAVAWASGAPWRVGFDAQHGGVFLTHKASAERKVIRHEIENQLSVLEPLGIVVKETTMEFRVDPHDVLNMKKKIHFQPEKPILVLCPFGRHPAKSWTKEGYSAILKELSLRATCYLIGGKAEEQDLMELSVAAGDVAHILAGTLTLGELAALLHEAKLLITVDTGPMHLGQAVGTPTVALFGPTDERVWGPRGVQDVVIKGKVDCMPCWLTKNCKNNACMEGITIQEVLQASLNTLGK